MKKSSLALAAAIHLCAVLLAGVPGGCAKGYDKPAVIKDNVFNLEMAPGFRSVEVTDNRLLFEFTDASLVPQLPDGAIVVGQSGNGYLRRVVGQVTGGTSLDLGTENATLTDAVESGRVRKTFGVEPVFTRLDPGQEIFGLIQDEAFPLEIGIDLAGTELYSGSVGDVDLAITIDSGELVFSPDIDLLIDVDDGEISHFHTYAEGNLSLDMVVTASASGSISYSSHRTFRVYQSPPLVQFIGIVPVVEVITLDVEVGFSFDAGVTGSVTAGMHASQSIRAGAEYEDGAWSQVWETDGSFSTVDPTWMVEGEFVIRPYIKPTVSVMFYGIVGPTLGIEPYLKFNACFLPPMWWELIGGVTGDLNFSIRILDFSLLDYTVDLFDYNQVIARDGVERDVCTLAVCGNGNLDYGEMCDRNDFGGATCASLGLGTGDLACRTDCTRDVTGCSGGSLCGNDDCSGDETRCSCPEDCGACTGCCEGSACLPSGSCGCTPSTEVCDGVDNDCDGSVDEGDVCTTCTPTTEVCDGVDNDCDGSIDEGGVCGGTCAWYLCSNSCWPEGTSNDVACPVECRDFTTQSTCDAHSADCAWYLCSSSCWPRGTSNEVACNSCGAYRTVTDCDAHAPTCAWYACSSSCWPTGTASGTACPSCSSLTSVELCNVYPPCAWYYCSNSCWTEGTPNSTACTGCNAYTSMSECDLH